MTCEEVRELLPAYVDGELHAVGEIDVHLTTCEACSAELGAYRRMLGELARMQEAGPAPAADLLARVVGLIPAPSLAGRARLVMLEHPVLYALAAAGGLAMGATALLLWRRVQRIPVAAA